MFDILVSEIRKKRGYKMKKVLKAVVVMVAIIAVKVMFSHVFSYRVAEERITSRKV